jgi:L-iditol 2-dehydrogenase
MKVSWVIKCETLYSITLEMQIHWKRIKQIISLKLSVQYNLTLNTVKNKGINMKQAIMISPGEITFRNVNKPIPLADEVLIQVMRIGVCGSDIHVYHGLHPYTKYPIVQGHEVSGIVAEVGSDVKGFVPGDAVTFMPQETCGKCYPCQHEMEHICDELKILGFQAPGAAQEYFSISATKVLKLPPTIDLDQAAMIEPLSVAVHAVNRAGNVRGKSALVLGAGTIGNLVGQVCRAMGVKTVVISDPSEYKLEMAVKCGLPAITNPQKEDPKIAINRYFGGDKADIIFECVGVEDTIGEAINFARKGSTIIVVGVFGRKPIVDIGLVQDRELNLIGSLMYQRQDYIDAISLITAGKLHLTPMITNRFPFNNYNAAYEFIEKSKGNSLKVMIFLD